ncbi:MAG TPA: ABC transporter permease [Vicinamibacterales bacterium]|nr:ABC transporter permease [Vicinamibacterales bacterium]
MSGFWRDVRFGARLLFRTPGVTLAAMLALALGIGANSAVFSVVYGVLLKPLPYPHPDRLVVIYDTQPALKTAPASYPKYIDWREENRVFEVIGGAQGAATVLTGQGEPERLQTANVTASFFRVFAVPPQHGRWFTEEEDQPGGAKVAILTHGLWERRFARDPRVIGRTITLDDEPRTVVGVMPKHYAYRTAEVFVPLARALDERQRGSHFLQTFGRLKPDIPLEQARQEMIALGKRLAVEHHHNHGIDVRALDAATIGDAAMPLATLLASVSLVLLIACANVANLLLARASARRREIAMRTALGAGFARLARQLLTESLLLSLGGGLLGLALAWAGVRAFVALAPPVLPRMTSITVDAPILVFTLGVAVATGLLFGLAPLLHARSESPAEALKDETGRSASGRSASRLGSALVIVEVALSVVLLVGAGLLVRSLARLAAQDAGFVAERVVAFDLALPQARYGSDEQVQRYWEQAIERVRAVPGVVSVGATSGLPLYRFGSNAYFEVEGKSLWKPEDAPLAEIRVVAGDYYKAMGIPLVQGRFFNERDTADVPPVVIINRAMASRFWPGEDPVGKRIRIGGDQWQEIVGVVGDVRSYSARQEPPLEVSAPVSQNAFRGLTFAVRSAGPDPTVLTASIRKELAVLDASQPMSKVQTLEEVASTSLGRPRLFSVLTASFAILAALLAAIGVYGLISYTVSRQRQEFGIRMALGADASDVRRMVVGRGARLAAAGVALGGLLAAGLARLITAMLYQVTPGDPVVYAVTCTLVFAVALAACYVPARAASRVDPIVTLRG